MDTFASIARHDPGPDASPEDRERFEHRVRVAYGVSAWQAYQAQREAGK